MACVRHGEPRGLSPASRRAAPAVKTELSGVIVTTEHWAPSEPTSSSTITAERVFVRFAEGLKQGSLKQGESSAEPKMASARNSRGPETYMGLFRWEYFGWGHGGEWRRVSDMRGEHVALPTWALQAPGPNSLPTLRQKILILGTAASGRIGHQVMVMSLKTARAMTPVPQPSRGSQRPSGRS